MTPIQQMFLGVGASKKTYLDDVFSTTLYKGNDSSNTITTNIDSSSNDSLLWIKNRTSTVQHQLFDTVRGANKVLKSNTSDAQYDGTGTYNQTFTSTGFTLNNSTSNLNSNNNDYSSWTFRKAPGFFDIVTYTGNETNRTIAHDLGCVPGMIIVKKRNEAGAWRVTHRGTDSAVSTLRLNTAGDSGNEPFVSPTSWNSTLPTATHFSIGTHSDVNDIDDTYVAYLFAGGESPAATAKSVDFDGTNDYLTIADHDDFDVGTNWTVECWFKCDAIGSNGWDAIFGQWDNAYVLEYVGTDLRFYYHGNGGGHKSLGAVPTNQWHHVAISKEGSITRIFLNGKQVVADFDMGTTSSSNAFNIGGNVAGGGWFNGKISNIRIVQGTAVYTSTFKPSTEPLTNITNTVLLCCNDTSQTGSTVTPGTITNNGATASINSPFDDPAAFVFGGNEDQGIIKCGSYGGNSSSSNDIYLGWEPQWVMIKRSNDVESWAIIDSMRGIVTGGNDARLQADSDGGEAGSDDRIDLTPTGFKLTSNNAEYNGSGTYVYLAIRRPDGYVGKPVEDATKVFNVIAGTSGDPTFKTGFVTDFITARPAASSSSWWTYSRLTGTNYLALDSDSAEGAGGTTKGLDFMNGFATGGSTSDTAWGWKRYAGFDVVTYGGDGVNGRGIAHSMNAVPEMMIVRRRSSAEDWTVYHTGLTSVNYHLSLNSTGAETDMSGSTEKVWKSVPTSTHFEIGSHDRVNTDGQTYLALLFSSVTGISKVGYYDGSSSTVTVTTGFQPRFLIVKRVNTTSDWRVFDTTRGWGAGNDAYLNIGSNAAQGSYQFGEPTSTGFTMVSDDATTNSNGNKYIYYAHA